jgi:hypothetical protein
MKKTLGTMVTIIVVAILTGTFITAKYATAGETARDGRFIAYSNGTVSDTRTNLMWAAKDNGSDINWAKAKSYCKNYRGGGYKDWRMPTQDELAGLYDKDKASKADRKDGIYLTELIRLTSKWVWASETNGSNAAYCNLSDGHRPWIPALSEGTGLRVLPVRSGK